MLVDRVLLRDVVLELDVEPWRLARSPGAPPTLHFVSSSLRLFLVFPRGQAPTAKRPLVPLRALNGKLPVLLVPGALVIQKVLADLRTKVPVDRDQPRAVLLKKFAIDPRLVVEPRQVRLGAQHQQVLPPLVVLAQEHQVVPALAATRIRPVLARLAGRRDIRLHAQDRLDPLLLAGLIDRHRPEDVAVVRHPHRRHAKLGHAAHQLVDAVPAVQQRVLRVQVQMDELLIARDHRHGLRRSRFALTARHDPAPP